MKKKVEYVGWIEKIYARNPFYWKEIYYGEKSLMSKGEGIFKTPYPHKKIKEVKIKITVEVVK